MPMTQHAPAPVSLPREDKSASVPTRSSPSYSPVADIRPIVSHQPSREPPLPSTRPASRSPSPQPPAPLSRSTPQQESPVQKDAKSEKPTPVERPKEEEEEEDEPEADDEPIVMDTFQQILELDEDDEREFSRDMVWAWFSQAEKTFGELDEALDEKDLSRLSKLGHYLKGSSAAMGVRRVEIACEKIQHYGQSRDEDLGKNLTDEEALDLIRKTLVRVKKDYTVADKWLRRFYEEGN